MDAAKVILSAIMLVMNFLTCN